MLTALILVPILGALLVGLAPSGEKGRTTKFLALAVAAAALVLSLTLVPNFAPHVGGFQAVQKYDWFPAFGVSFHVGIDGISIWLVVLTCLLTLVAVAFSTYVDKNIRLFMAMVLLLEGAMLGAFVSLDLIFFFTFFELTLIPMWLIMNGWGGERRAYAANKFLIYTFAGSIFLLIGIGALAFRAQAVDGRLTFDILALQSAVANGKMWTDALQMETFVFWGFAAAFLVKSPIFPFHTWVPDTYAESPTAGPILSGAMVKLGSYGFLRFCLPLFPDAAKANVALLSALAIVGILYAAIVATVQTDARRLLAYSSISHMGFVLLGIFTLDATGMVGGAYQQLNHGIVSCMLFLLLGYLYQRRGTTMFADFGGLKAQMPIFATLFLIAMLGGVGLPGTNGFVGEFLALLGLYRSGYSGQYGFSTAFAFAAAGSMVVTAVYMLVMFQRIFYGANRNPLNQRLKDLKSWEIGVAGVLAALVIYGGLQPSTFTSSMEPAVISVQQMVVRPANSRPVWADNEVPTIGAVAQSTPQETPAND